LVKHQTFGKHWPTTLPFLVIIFLLFSLSSWAQTKPAILDSAGETGATNYLTLPFASAFLEPAGGASPYLAPGNLFWANGSYFTNASAMFGARSWASQQIAKGLLPYSGSQLWVDTYEASQPASLFPNEPSNIAADRNSGCCSTGEFQAWVQWVKARPSLQVMANDGGTLGFDFRAWGSSWGHISPLMPMAAKDCPPNTSPCTYGDWYAYRWAQTSAITGAPAIGLSDFSDSQPYAYSTQEGFNPEIIAGFEAAEGVAVPAGTTSQQSAWIIAHAMTQWNDYLDAGYGKFFGALASQIATQTNLPSLVLDQCAYWPSLRRFFGIDPRIISNYISSKNYLCTWDEQSIQVGRAGEDPVQGIGGYGMAAARDPWVRNGAALESNDSNFWAAMAYFYPTLSAADQQERGLKILKRLWLEASWAHIATTTGTVRRALAFASRDYFDAGTVDPTVTRLIQSIYPTAPFGFGIYYSVAAERAVETNLGGSPWSGYYQPAELLALKQAGIPVNYFVSDAAIKSLTTAAYPTAWIIMDNAGLIPAAEMALLNKTSNNRVFTSLQQAQAFATAPLSFTNGLTGTGFYDQNQRLIVTATNISANSVSGLIQLQGLAAGAYTLLDLFTNQTSTFSVAHGAGNVAVTIGRWDTRAFAITK
jgi:hypothetical protein